MTALKTGLGKWVPQQPYRAKTMWDRAFSCDPKQPRLPGSMAEPSTLINVLAKPISNNHALPPPSTIFHSLSARFDKIIPRSDE